MTTKPLDFETEDLKDPAVIADPYRYFNALRETDPVHWNPLMNSWVVTRHRDVSMLLRKPEVFSSALATLPPAPQLQPPIPEADWPLAERFREEFLPFINLDRPEHLAMRKSVHRWFTPKAVEKWREELRTSAHRLIEAQREAKRMDVLSDFALHLPLSTIGWMLGLPPEDASRLRDVSNSVIAADAADPGRMRRAVGGWDEFQEYFGPLLDRELREPSGDNLISMLAEAEREGAATRRQSMANAVLILVAGHETTMNLIANGLVALLRNPDQWELLKSDPQAYCAGTVEECLRYEPSLKGAVRILAEDFELGDKMLAKGDRVFWSISAANRDPEVFADPERFDIRRSPNPHVAFGGGIHHCLGSALARVEAQEAFRALAELLPDMKLQEEPLHYTPALIFRGLESVEVHWS